jgi:seryl-tRNA synthetase
MAKRDKPMRKEPKSVENLRRRQQEIDEAISSAKKRNAHQEVANLRKEKEHIDKSIRDYKDRERKALSGSK